MVSMVPQHLRLMFWDANLDELDPTAYPFYAIERVLEYGDEEAVGWMRRTFTEEQILDVLRTDRRRDGGEREQRQGIQPDHGNVQLSTVNSQGSTFKAQLSMPGAET